MRDQFDLKPRKGGAFLLATVAVLISLPASVFLAAILAGTDVASGEQVLRTLVFVAPVAVAVALWIFNQHAVWIHDGVARFSYTRYGIPRRSELRKDDLVCARYVGGPFALDGRPRPLVEYELRSGRRGWLPFPLYSRKQIREVLGVMRANGFHVDETPQ